MLKVFEGDQYGYGTNNYEEIPIRCSDQLYNYVPSDGSVLHYLTAREGGYISLSELRMRIEEVLFFSPFEQAYYKANSAIIGDTLFSEVMNNAAPQKVFLDDENHYYVDAPSSGLVVGWNLFETEPSVCTCGLFKDPIPAIGRDAIFISRDGNDVKYFNYLFDFYPETLIEGDTYDIDSLRQPPNDDNPDHKFYGSILIQIWYDTATFKYNGTIDIQGYSRDITQFRNWLTSTGPGNVFDTDDPNNNNPNDTNQGGNGLGDNGSDQIPLPTLPGSDMTAAGSIRLYSMSNADLAGMFAYLHSNAPGESILKWWTNPIQGLVSLHYLPYAVKLKSGSESIKIAGMDTTIVATPCDQFQQVNFGYVLAPTNKNTYLDRAPYTRSQIYLPGIGIRDLNTDDIIGKYVFVVYQMDNATGQFVAYVLVGTSTSVSRATVKYSFSGSVAAPFPTSQTNWGNTYIAAATLAAGALAAGVGAIGAGAGAGAAGATGAAAEGAAAGTGSVVTAGGVAGATTNIGSSLSQLAKPSITRSGTVSGTTSLFSVKRPYLILEKPNVQDYADFNKIKGYACGMTLKLGDLKGYTEVERIHITGITATATEINEIEALLRQGVIL